MRHPHVQSVIDRLTMTTETTVKGFVSAQDTSRLLGYCTGLLKLDRLSAGDREACRRYLKMNRPLTVAEARRIGVIRRMYARRKK